MNRHATSRRTFLRTGAAAFAGAALRPEGLLADPYAPLGSQPTPTRPGMPAAPTTRSSPIVVQGVVRSRGRGIPRVPVSDGVQVVDTDADGTFEILTRSERGFVWFTPPSGYRIPLNRPGTARFYQALSGRQQQTATFDLEPDPVPQDDHTLLLLGDIQAQDERETGLFLGQSVPDISETIAGLGGEHVFGISCGDIMYDNLYLYPDYERGVRMMEVPFF